MSSVAPGRALQREPSSAALDADTAAIRLARKAAASLGYNTSQSRAQELQVACHECGKKPSALARALQICSFCQRVAYCGPACQRSAWRKGHKSACKDLAKASVETLLVKADASSGESAAERASAMHNLGLHYATGRGVQQSSERAIAAYRAAAVLGCAEAMTNLGSNYGNGTLGLKQDWPAAIAWFRAGADAGDALAMANLAVRYLTGDGVSQSASAAQEWAERGAALGNDDCVKLLDTIFRGSSGVSADDSAFRLKLSTGAERGESQAMYLYGILLRDGPGRTNAVESLAWFERAASAGFAEAHADVGLAYATGRGTAVNHARALDHYTRGAAAGVVTCVSNLGNVLYDGRGCVRNAARALEEWKRAVELGATGATLASTLTGISHVLLGGEGGVPRDLPGGMDALLQAARLGCPGAMAEYAYRRISGADPADPLGIGPGSGPGCASDLTVADAWARAALTAGQAAAAKLIDTVEEMRKEILARGFPLPHDSRFMPPADIPAWKP